jgi:hypothetical protein
MEQAAFPFLERTILTVSGVSERIKIVLEDTFFDIWVEVTLQPAYALLWTFLPDAKR